MNATLLAALQAGHPRPYLMGYIGYVGGSVKHSEAVIRYKLTATTLEFEMAYHGDFASDQEVMWLARGLTIAGTTYSVTTGRFYIVEQRYLPNGNQYVKGSLFPKVYYEVTGNTYSAVIDAFCTHFGKTAVYREVGEAWQGYRFYPVGEQIILSDANDFLPMLKQKRLINLADLGSEQVLVYCTDVYGSSDASVVFKDEWVTAASKQHYRQYYWKDEVGAAHQDGTATYPIHNLGYLQSTASPPARHSGTYQFKGYIRPDLRFLDGDRLQCAFWGATAAVNIFARVTEEFEPDATVLPAWRVIIEADPIFNSTEGGQIQDELKRLIPYAGVDPSSFGGVLSDQDTNIQQALVTLDDHVHTFAGSGDVTGPAGATAGHLATFNGATGKIIMDGGAVPAAGVTDHGALTGLADDDHTQYAKHSLATAASDFLVASGVGAFVKKTLAEVKTLLGYREKLTADRTYYVRKDGSDANTGLADTAGGAFLTIQHAIDIVVATLDIGGYVVTIQTRVGTYAENLSLYKCLATPLGAIASIQLRGDTTTPANVIISPAGGDCIIAYDYAGIWSVGGFKVETPDGTGIGTRAGSYISIDEKMVFGDCGGDAHMNCQGTGVIGLWADYEVTGDSAAHVAMYEYGKFQSYAGSGTMTGTPAFSDAFLVAAAYGVITIYAGGYTGAISGTNAHASDQATIAYSNTPTNATRDIMTDDATINGVSFGRTVVTTPLSKTTDTALANIADLNQWLEAGIKCAFEIILYTTCGTSGGVKYDLDGGTATATAIVAHGEIVTTSHATAGTARTTALATDICNLTNVTSPKIVIEGTIEVNAAGTFIPRFAQNASNGTASIVLAGSSMLFTEL